MNTGFDDAKEFIKQALQDISFSEIKAHLNSTVNLGGSNDAMSGDYQEGGSRPMDTL